MTQQRMAGGDQFKKGMEKASQPVGGGRSHMNSAPQLIGADAWDRQVQRENQQSSTSTSNSGGSGGATLTAGSSGTASSRNLQTYIDVSKSATQSNGDFSINAGNKWSNNSREQSKINKEDNKGFSDNRVSTNVNVANTEQDKNIRKNEGFAMNTTNQFVDNAKRHRDDNSRKATQFAQNTVNNYIQKNKANQAINVGGLDQQIRAQPIVDRAYSTVQGLNTYGDMYRYGRENLPIFNQPDPAKPVERPDFNDMYDRIKDDIGGIKVKG